MQGDSTITSFFTSLQASWDQLLNFRPLPCCSCGKCTCGVNNKITNLQHQDSLMQFLNGLNDSYSQVRTQILMIEPITSIDKAFSLVIQEERQRCLGFNVNPSVESTALAAKNQGFNQSSSLLSNNSKNFKGNTGKERPMCSHCGKVGHCRCLASIGAGKTAVIVGLHSTTHCGDALARAGSLLEGPLSLGMVHECACVVCGVVCARLQVLSHLVEEGRSTFGIMVGIWAKF